MSAGLPQLPAIGEHVGDGRFELLGLLGESGTSAVFRARDAVLAREVALALLIPGDIGRPERERRLLDGAACLRRVQGHPNIIQLIDAGRLPERDGWPWLATELLDGQPLDELGGQLAPTTIIDVARQLAAALHACHAAGVAHRDVTPRNVVLLADERTIKLSGFGHAGDLADVAVDAYGLGLMLVELVTGHTPHPDGTGEPPRLHAWPDDTPEHLADLVNACTRDGARRPSMVEIIAVLDSIAVELTDLDDTLDTPPIGRVDEDRVAELRARPIARRRLLELGPPADAWPKLAKQASKRLVVASAIGPTATKHQAANRLARERRAAKQRAKERLTEQARLVDEEIRAEEARLVAAGVDISDIIETAALINAITKDSSDEG